MRWEPLGVVASPAAEGPGRRAGRRRLDRHTASGVHQKDRAPACSPEPARHQGLVTETTLGRAWHLRRERKEVGGCPPPTPHCPPGSSLQKGAPEKCHAPDRTVLGTVVTVTHIPGAVLWSDAQLVGKFTT